MSILVSNLLLFILLFTLTLGLIEEDANVSSCIEKERRALLDVKAALVDVKANVIDLLYGDFSDWGSEGGTMDCCKWVGVRCSNHTSHVIELDVTAFNPHSSFKGNISVSLQVLDELQYLNLNNIDFESNPFPEFLGLMSNLQRLDISGANLNGSIPHQLGNLPNLLHLDLGRNSLSGPIPHQLGNLSNLLHLDLGRNSLSGSIPLSFGDLTSLTYLDLSQNQLGGVIPNSFGNCSSLVHLDLSENLLNGPLPSFVECSSLINMSLAHNSLNGSMPDFTGCTSLQKLDLSSNFLSGNMPSSMDQLSNLEYLDVGHNSLNGSLPDFEGCPFISYLDLSSNQLSGNVPNSLGQVSNLEVLDLSSNSLEGVITEVHFLNLTHLWYLDLSFNPLAVDLNIHDRVPFRLLTLNLQSCVLGPRFPMWIKALEIIKHLDISSARISDSPPAWFWDLPIGLEFLNLSSNQIKGVLPDITYSYYYYPGIDLSNNHFEGRVPSLPSKLASLNLSGNRFSGPLSFLCDIEEHLTFLDLSNNSLSGSLPDCWLKFQKELVVLNLSYNNLSGEIPSSLGLLSKLEAMYLRTNSFVGELPMSLNNCTRLRFLDLRENKLSGVIPEWIGEKLSKLYVLVLGSNRFYGRLPSQVCWLHNLQVLDLSNNGLSGYIPRCFDNFTAMASESFGDDMTSHSYYSYIGVRIVPDSELCQNELYHLDSTVDQMAKGMCPYQSQKTHFLDNTWVTWKGTKRSFGRSGLQLLRSIDLSRNNLSGILPNEITSLYELVSLNLSTNKLYGEVVKDIGRLNSLESLDLSRNDFSGHIPWSLAQLTFLSYLDLSYNNLSGRIPTGTQLQGFNYTTYSGNPQLCGPPLTPKCGFAPPTGKKDIVEEDENDDYRQYFYTVMGVGYVVGFWGICGPLYFNRRCRYIFFASSSHMKDWIYVTAVVHFRKLGRNLRK